MRYPRTKGALAALAFAAVASAATWALFSVVDLPEWVGWLFAAAFVVYMVADSIRRDRKDQR